MPRKITYRETGVQIGVGYNGITFYIDDPNNPVTNGRLRVGKLIRWTDAGKGKKPYRAKTWDELINFMKR